MHTRRAPDRASGGQLLLLSPLHSWPAQVQEARALPTQLGGRAREDPGSGPGAVKPDVATLSEMLSRAGDCEGPWRLCRSFSSLQASQALLPILSPGKRGLINTARRRL